MVEQTAKHGELKFCQSLHRQRLTCRVVLTGEDARSQAKAILASFAQLPKVEA